MQEIEELNEEKARIMEKLNIEINSFDEKKKEENNSSLCQIATLLGKKFYSIYYSLSHNYNDIQ